jgi:dephospho-CoA kinase
MRNLGFIGTVGSGKGFASKYVARKYGYKIIVMGNIIRVLAKKEKVKITRESLQEIQKKHSKKGRDYAIDKALEKARKIKGPIILDGLRKPIQIKLAKKELKAKIILVDADPMIRFERMKKRGRKGFSKTIKEFQEVEKRENKFFDLDKSFKLADYKIDNSKDKKHLFNQLDKIVK